MSRFPETNASWIPTEGMNTIGEEYPINPTTGALDPDPQLEQLHPQLLSEPQFEQHQLYAQIQENSADAHRPVMPQFGGSRYSSTQDPVLKEVESYMAAPIPTTILSGHESQQLAVEDLALNDAENHIAGLEQAQLTTERESQPPSASEESAIHTVEHHVSARAQIPSKCNLCSEKGHSCDGNQESGKSCTVCNNSKHSCSFIPRNYACEICHGRFIRRCDLRTHNTKVHKKPSLKTAKKFTYTGDTPAPSRQLRRDSKQLTTTSDASRPSKRVRNDSKEQSPKHTDTSANQVLSTDQMESPQIMATQPNQAVVGFQTDSAHGITNGSSVQLIQREHTLRLYQPDSPAYEPPHEVPHKLRHTASHFDPCQKTPVVDSLAQRQNYSNILQQLSPIQLRENSSSENARISSQSQMPTVNTLAQNKAQGAILQQNSPINFRGSSTPSRRSQLSCPRRLSPVQDFPSQHKAQDNTMQQSSSVEPEEILVTLKNSDHGIYLQFPNRVMRDSHVENRLGSIREDIKLYEEFIRGADIQYTSAEVEERFNFLTKVKPFVTTKEVLEESSDFFASQPSRLVVLWRAMLEVHPTASLRDELVRLDLEGLELPVVICGSLGYILLRTVFDEPDRLRAAERKARLESVQRLHGAKFAVESIKHDQLFIHEDKSVDRELRKPARDLAERQIYELLYPLTHWDLENPTTKMKATHISKLSDIALKSLRLSRELQARRTEDYSYFWPRPGEPFNHYDHIDIEDDQTRSQSGRIIRWTLMFGVKASRDGQQQKVYAKAIVMTMEA